MMMKKKIIPLSLSKKILTLGVSKKTNGGMAAVLVSYDLYFENMRFIPTWKLSNKLVKLCYVLSAFIRTLILLLLDRRIKIIHIHGAANASFYRKALFIRLASFMKKKVILHMHAADFEEFYANHKNKTYITNILNRCDVLIVLSKMWRDYFIKIGIPYSKIEILNNIVSMPQLIFSNESKLNKLHLLFLGEIGSRKGIFDLLEAISKKKDYFFDKLILRIGGNEVEGDLKRDINKKGLSEFVHYEGWIYGEEKTECLNWADVYILPSYNEGLPIAILEAMSYSHPIISTPVGGIPEIVLDGYNGFIVEPGNIRDISHALEKFIDNPDLVKEMGENSFKLVQPFFPESVLNSLKNIYQKLL